MSQSWSVSALCALAEGVCCTLQAVDVTATVAVSVVTNILSPLKNTPNPPPAPAPIQLDPLNLSDDSDYVFI